MAHRDTLRFDIVDHVMLIVHADVAPAVEDWARMMLVRSSATSGVRACLVVAPPRATLTAAQRGDVVRFTKDGSIAVLTESALIRGVAAAVGLLGVQVRAFAPSEEERALNYLGLRQGRHTDALRRLALLKSQLAPSARTSTPA